MVDCSIGHKFRSSMKKDSTALCQMFISISSTDVATWREKYLFYIYVTWYYKMLIKIFNSWNKLNFKFY